ncbi:Initiator Rep protein domain protein, partial [mine drainage metagenome]
MSLSFKKSAALIFSSENLLPTGIKLLDAILFSAQKAAAGDKLRTDVAGASPDGIAPGAISTSREGAPPGPCDQQAVAILTRGDLALVAGPQSLARVRKMANLLAKTDIVVDGVSAPALAWQETTKRGDILYRLSPHIVPHVVPRIYGRLSACYLRTARSGHALRLYEIAALYAGRKNPTWEVGIDRLIEIFGLPEAYRNRPDNLKARVVEAAIDEINAASPLLVAYEMLPAGAKHARPLFRFFAGHKTANANPVA